MKIANNKIIKFEEHDKLRERVMYKEVINIIMSYGFRIIKKALYLNQCVFEKDRAFYKFSKLECFQNFIDQQLDINYIELNEII